MQNIQHRTPAPSNWRTACSAAGLVFFVGTGMVAPASRAEGTSALPSSWEGTLIFEGNCIAPPPPPKKISESVDNQSALLTALVTGIISAGVDIVGKAMKKAGEDVTKAYSAETSLNTSLANNAITLPPCLRFLNGKFFTSSVPTNVAEIEGGKEWVKKHDWTDREKKLEAMMARLKLSPETFGQNMSAADFEKKIADKGSVHLADVPDFMLEVAPEASPDGKAIRFVPTLLMFNRSDIGGRHTRELVAQLILHDVDNPVEDSDQGGGVVKLGSFVLGDGPWVFANGDNLAASYSPWFKPFKKAATVKPQADTKPGTPENGSSAGGEGAGALQETGNRKPATNGKEDGSPTSNNTEPGSSDQGIFISPSSGSGATPTGQVAPKRTQDSKQLNVTMRLVETRRGSKFWKALGGVFEESKEELEVELQKLALKSKRKEANEAEQQEKEAAMKEYNNKIAAVEKSKATCSKADADAKVEAWSALLNARIDANAAARAAGLPEPFKTEETTSSGGTPTC